MKLIKKALICFLTITMIFTYLPVVKAKDTKEYKIYPTPQNIKYLSDSSQISKEANVIYDDDIDKYTQNHLKNILKIIDVNMSVSKDIVDGKTNILVGIYNSNDIVDQYFKTNKLIKDEKHFEKNDSSILHIENNNIVLLGKDTDAAFYGLTSLKHIFNQSENRNVLNLHIEDYADVKGRGFIEGYYGNPWSNEDRSDLMTFGGDYKVNQYIYAPKDDPKHNEKWRELYTESELQDIKELAEAGNKAKCYYVYALHPFMHSAISFGDKYDKDLDVIKQKLEQLMKVGVKQFSILADDAALPGNDANNYVRLMTDITDWLIEKQAEYEGLKVETIFCPNDYMGDGSSKQMQILKNLPESVSIIETGSGGQANPFGFVSPEFTNKFYGNMERPAYMWVNWPCTDFYSNDNFQDRDHLIMGGATDVLKPKVNPQTIDGVILNPMQQSEPSKEAIFTNADYAWNIWQSEEKYDEVWDDSFHFMDHGTVEQTEASIALREISKHMISSSSYRSEESVDLKDRLNKFYEDLNSGKDIKLQVEDIKNEFTKLQKSAETYKNNPGNERTRAQIVYWLDCWQDTTEAIIKYLDTAVALQENKPEDEIWAYYSDGQKAFESSKTHTFKYLSEIKKAVVGRQYITPFMKKLDKYLSTRVITIADPSKQVITGITSRTDLPVNDIDMMMDGDNGTFASWNSPRKSQVDEFVGFTYAQSIELTEVSFLMSDKKDSQNTFKSAKLQYTEDGKIWKDIEGDIYENYATEIKSTNLKLTVKGVRVICSEETPDISLSVREIYVNGKSLNGSSDFETANKVFTEGLSIYSGSNDNLIDGNDKTAANYTNGQGQKTVGIDLGTVKSVEKVRFIMGGMTTTGKWKNYDLEYSKDGETYIKFKSYVQTKPEEIILENFNGIEARFVRIKNTESRAMPMFGMSEFTVTPMKKVYTVDTNREDISNIKVRIEDNEASINAIENITLNQNDYIGVELPRIRDLSDIQFDLVNGEDLTLQTSVNHIDWIQADLDQLEDARYVRLINLKSNSVTFNIDVFKVVSKEYKTPYLYDDTKMPITPILATKDTRKNGAAFDFDINTTTEIGTMPDVGQYIVYDLGQERTINKIQLFCQDTAVKYLRDGEVYVSNDLEGDWTKVVTIGDGIANTADGLISALNSGSYPNSSKKYPNKVYAEGTCQDTQARYLKILVTAPCKTQDIVINEIMINDGEYVQEINDPRFESNIIEERGHQLQNLIDNDITTTYKPNTTKSGYVTYTLSENMNIQRLHVVSRGEISHAKVEIYVKKDGKKEWVEVGSLEQSMTRIYLPFWNDIYKIRITWEDNQVPQISELIMLYDGYGTTHTALSEYIKTLDVDESKYTRASYQSFIDVLNNAKEINNNNNSSQQEIDEELLKLQLVFSQLEKPGDKQLIKDELDDIKELDKNEYTLESFNQLEKVVKEAELLLDKHDRDITVLEVTNIVEKLQVTKAKLESSVPMTKDILAKYIDDNKLDQLDLSQYTSITAQKFSQILKRAHLSLEDKNITAKEINEIFIELKDARSQLALKATNEQLNLLQTLTKSYDKHLYTKASWEIFEKVLIKAENIVKASDPSSQEVQTLINEMNEASKKLVKLGDKSEIDSLIDIIEGLDKNKYTSQSYNHLIDVLNKVKTQLKEDVSQKQINEFYSKLHQAMSQLVSIQDSHNVITGDETNILVFAGLTLIGGLSLFVLRKKKKV